jgi:hypothetical protein
MPARQSRSPLACFFFPSGGGLNPANSMMVMPLIQTPGEILWMCAISWVVLLLDIWFPGGFGGFYLLIVLAAMALLLRRLKSSARQQMEGAGPQDRVESM